MKDKHGCPLADRLNVIYIDLLTIKRLVGTPVEKLTPLQKWGMYFSYADDESKTGYIGQIGNSERGIMEATTIIKTMSEDDAAFFREFSRDKAIRDYNAGISAAKRKGMEAGYAQGREEGEQQGREEGIEIGTQQKAVETAKNMLARKYNVEEIAELTGLPLEQVLELQSQATAQPSQA